MARTGLKEMLTTWKILLLWADSQSGRGECRGEIEAAEGQLDKRCILPHFTFYFLYFSFSAFFHHLNVSLTESSAVTGKTRVGCCCGDIDGIKKEMKEDSSKSAELGVEGFGMSNLRQWVKGGGGALLRFEAFQQSHTEINTSWMCLLLLGRSES